MNSPLSYTNKGRVAVLDLLFCWPPNGGADVDVYSVMAGLAARSVPVKLFVVQLEGTQGRGRVQPGQVPFPAELIVIPKARQNPDGIVSTIKRSLVAWSPEIIFFSHGYLLKTLLLPELKPCKTIGRYYAHELFCMRDALRFKDGMPCPLNPWEHPLACHRCAFESLGGQIKSGNWPPWTHEYLLAEAWQASFQELSRSAMESLDRIVLYNHAACAVLGPWKDKAVVIPGGVNAKMLLETPGPMNSGDMPVRLLMTGRVEDPVKGLEVLLEACRLLRRQRQDFELILTHFDPQYRGDFFSSTGWLSHAETMQLYKTADMVIVPSLWEEPFGLVAVEAMAAGLPVCASDIGGLRDIVVHEETGILFPPGDAHALSSALDRLVSSPTVRHEMGQAAFRRVREHYTWDTIIEDHYLPLLESLWS